MSKHVLSLVTLVRQGDIMTTIIIAITTIGLTVSLLLDPYKPCPVKWHDDLRNHEERMDKCTLKSRNKHIGWELKE